MSDLKEIEVLKQRVKELEKHSELKCNKSCKIHCSIKDTNTKDTKKSSPESSPKSSSSTPKSSRSTPRYMFPSSLNSDSEEEEDTKSIKSEDEKEDTKSIDSSSSPKKLKEAFVTLNKSSKASIHGKREKTFMFFEGDYIKIYTMINQQKVFIIIPSDSEIFVKEKLSPEKTRVFQYILPQDTKVVKIEKNVYVVDTMFYRKNEDLFKNLKME